MNSLFGLYNESASVGSDKELAQGMARLRYVEDKIIAFAKLSQGWHFGRGHAPSNSVRVNAINMVKSGTAHGLWRTNAFPGTEGSILVSFRHDDHIIEIEIDAESQVTFSYDKGQDEVEFKDGLTVGQAIEKLTTYAKTICTSAPYTLSISTNSTDVGTEWLSSPRVTEERQYFVLIVQSKRLEESASISVASTPANLLTPQSTGGFMPYPQTPLLRSSQPTTTIHAT
jgi:hypothetical protein